MTSPTSTSGVGFKFEDHVVASYLTAMLAEAPARGLVGTHVTTVLTQRAGLGHPLDDLVVCGQMADGSISTLTLQVTADLAFTAADEKWVKTVSQAWSTFSAPSFQQGKDALGVAISAYSARADKYYRTLLTWATGSPSPSDFFKRLWQKGLSHKDQRSFVATLRTLLEQAANRTISDEELWKFLQAFRIIHFDLATKESSRDAEAAKDRVRQCLPIESRHQTSAVWDHLVIEAGAISAVAGGTTRPRLISQLLAVGYQLGSTPSFARDLQALTQESERILAGIKTDIHGLQLSRAEVAKQVDDALAAGRFVQIDGEPGSGKSAILKELAREAAQSGPIFFLKDLSIHPRGWSAHATQVGVTRDLPRLLAELGASGQSLLFIDGIDKVIDAAAQLTINDILRAIAHDQRLIAWKVVVTVREQNLDHFKSWLDSEALSKLPIKTVTVPMLSDADLFAVASHFQQLRPLLVDGQHLDHLLRRPFFLDAMVRLTGRDASQALPASEIELMNLWWRLGGTEGTNAAAQQHRRNALLTLAERLLESPGYFISIRDVSPEALEDLRTAGVIKDQLLGHSVTFTHDIYEEWSLCQWLLPNVAMTAHTLERAREPNALIRPVQLAASFVLEMHSTDREWRQLYENVRVASLRPVWQRMVLLGAIRTTQSTVILSRVADSLKANAYDGLRKVISALATLEVTPDARYLDEAVTPGLTNEQRVSYAHHEARPKMMIWIRFLDWFLADDAGAVPFLPELVGLFSTWQDACGGRKIRHCIRIGEIAAAWLDEFETPVGSRHQTKPKDPFGLQLPSNERNALESELRSLLLKSAPYTPDFVSSYLKKYGTNRAAHSIQRQIVQHSQVLAQAVPIELTLFIKSVFFETLNRHQNVSDDDFRERTMGIAGFNSFSPASPLQPPFIHLLTHAESVGLQLIRDTCNHCLTAWRASHLRGSRGRSPLTPESFTISFAWGTQSFWGDETVYAWFRGAGRLHACTSALMALEKWALYRVAVGDDLEGVIRKVVEGNESAGALGVAVSICLANAPKAVPAALPLITSPHIWHWDVNRSGREPSFRSTNAMGNWGRDRVLLTAVRDLNNEPHRDRAIRDLVSLFICSADPSVHDRYLAGIEQLFARLPIAFAEELADEQHVAALQKTMSWYLELAHPKHWVANPVSDNAVEIVNAAPSLNSAERLETLAGLQQMNDRLGLMTWAHGCLTADGLPESPPLAEAVTVAKAIDHADLFERPNDDLHDSQRRDAVAGVAFVVARFAPATLWDPELAEWCFRTLTRAASYRDVDPYMLRESVLMTHPTLFSAAGFSALLNRGYEPEQARRFLMALIGHPIHAINATVVSSGKWYAQQHPDFYALLFVLSALHCVIERSALDGRISLTLSTGEMAAQRACWAAAEKALATHRLPALPRIPLPWIPRTGARPSSRKSARFQPNPMLFRWDVAPHTLLKFDVGLLLSDRSLRAGFLLLVDDLREMTFQEMAPPFADPYDHGGNVPHEWVYAFFHWLGITATHLSPAEVEQHVLAPLRARTQTLDLQAMHYFMPAFLGYGLMPPAEVSHERLELWKKIATWVLDHPAARPDHERVDEHIAGCLTTLLFCVERVYEAPVCVADPEWRDLTRFLSIIERVIQDFGAHQHMSASVLIFLSHAGRIFFPRPGLDWLVRITESAKHNKQFWSRRGDAMTALLRDIHEKQSNSLSAADRATISLITDVLVDNAVRAAAMLQQQLLRDSSD